MLTWYLIGAVAAVCIAWVAAMLNLSGHAPVGILALGVGLALGAAFRGIAALLRIAAGRKLVVGTIVLATLAALAQHAWLYRDFRRQWQTARAKSPTVAMFRPETPWTPVEYFRNELTAGRLALWSVDAAVIVAAACGTVIVTRRGGARTHAVDRR